MKNVVTILLFVSTLLGEIIDGPANVRYTPGGNPKFELVDSISVYCSEPTDGWHQVMVDAQIRKSDLENKILIKKGIPIYSANGDKIIGNTLDIISISGKYDYSNNPAFIKVLIYGYTYKSNIRVESIVERELEKLFIMRDTDLIQSFIVRFDFSVTNLGEYRLCTLTESNDPWMSSDLRLFICLDDRDAVLAIGTKTRTVNKGKRIKYNLGNGINVQFEPCLLTETIEYLKRELASYFYGAN